MSRSSFASLAVVVAGLILVGRTRSEASELSEVTIGIPQLTQTPVAENLDPSAIVVSEVTISREGEAGPAPAVGGREAALLADTISEVTIQPPLPVAARRESRRSGMSLSTGDAPATGGSGVCKQ